MTSNLVKISKKLSTLFRKSQNDVVRLRFFCKPAKMAVKKMSFVFGMEVEERKMSEKRLSCLNAEQESPEPVEYEVIECFTF